MTTNSLKKLINTTLSDNAELALYAENRRRDAKHPYTPNYHFKSPGGYLNDPCGLCFINGLYHLFYQFTPEHKKILGWGHAVSTDLYHWQDLPMSLTPTYDIACGSGGALVNGKDLYVCYQGATRENPLEGAISVAKGSGKLFETWEKLSDGPVIRHKKAFDPCMWVENGKYYLLSAGGGSLPHPDNIQSPDHRKFYLYESDDLEHWTFLHNFIENDCFASIGDDGACPYFLPFGDGRYILLHFSHKSGGHWIVGNYDRERMKFIAEDGGAFNTHSWMAGGVHAPSAFVDRDGSIVSIFNVNYGYYEGATNQIMSLPRRLTPDQNGRPYAEPYGFFSTLRKKHERMSDLLCRANEEVVLKSQGNCFELEITADVAKESARVGNFIPPNLLPLIEIRVLRSPDAREHTDVRFYRNRAKMNWDAYSRLGSWSSASDSVLELDLSSSTLGNTVCIHPAESAYVAQAPTDPVKLHIFVDKSIIEVFANGQCITTRTYPTLSDSTGISIISKGVDAVVSYDFWELDIGEEES